MECLLLKEEYNASFTLAGTVYTVHIPQDGLVYVSSIPGKGADSIVVEYGDYNGLIVPVSMCRAIPEDDEIVYDAPVEKRICMDWDSNCPYQLSVKANDTIRIFRENEDYYYGSIVAEDESKPQRAGWVQKSLFM